MKGGALGTILPVLGGIAALGTGLGAAGIGPLAGLFSAGDAAGAAGADAAGLATAGTDAATAGTAAALPATAGDVSGLLGTAAQLPGEASPLAAFDAGALPAAGSLTGTGLPLSATQLAANTAGGVTDIGAGAGTGGDFMFPGTSSPFMAGTPAGDVSSFLTPSVGGASDVGVATDAAFPVIGPAFNTPAAATAFSADPSAAAAFDATAPVNAVSDAGGGFITPTGPSTFDTGEFSMPTSGSTVADAAGGNQTPWWQRPQNYLAAAPLALFALQRMMNPSGLPPGGQAVQQAAQTAAQNEGILTGQGQQNFSYLNTGAVPAGANDVINNAVNAQKAEVRSAYAAMGVPAGSTMEAQQLAAVDANAAAQKLALQTQLLQAGNNQFQTAGGFGGQVGQLDTQLMLQQIQQEQELEQALAYFTGGVAASGGFTQNA